MSALHEALLEIQKDPPQLLKDAANPHFGNEYISLESLLATLVPVLNEKGILLVQETTSVGPSPAVATRLIHVDTGEEIGGAMPLVLDKESPQAVGSAITYYRRYGLLSLLGLTADKDDDAEGAMSSNSRTTSGKSGQKQPKNGSW